MNLGDKVEWTSQAGGRTKKKTGVIVAIVPARNRHRLTQCIPGLNMSQVYSKYNTGPIDGGGLSRNHESYLVEVKTGKTEAAKKSLYWPRVSGLKDA